ncbi:MAG TPA: DUF885 family protein, partial [Gemmatimonadales bacterium]
LEQAEPVADPGPEALAELRRIDAFLADRELFPAEVPGLVVAALPAWLAPAAWPAAYIPPPLAASGAGELLLSDSRGARALFSPIVAEAGYPGMHLQAALSQRLASEVRRFSDPLLRGGWGLYALEVLEEAGYWSTPEARLAVRAHQLFRLVLARVDIGVHTRQMTMEEGIAALLDRLPLDPSEAEAAVRGVLLAPTQAAGAVSAWKELSRLRADREKAEHPFFTLRGFHDRVLACGGLPVPLARWAIES